MGRAIISNASVEWLDVHDYKVSDGNVRNGIDYHMLTWEKRSMDLDDLKVDENHVVTGLYLYKTKYCLNISSSKNILILIRYTVSTIFTSDLDNKSHIKTT